MELKQDTAFMVVYDGVLRKCKFVTTLDALDAQRVQLQWYRLPTPTMQKQFELHLQDMGGGFTEWALHGYDEEKN